AQGVGAAVADERKGAAVGAEGWQAAVPVAVGELAGRRPGVEVEEEELVAALVRVADAVGAIPEPVDGPDRREGAACKTGELGLDVVGGAYRGAENQGAAVGRPDRVGRP